ncbi:MAG: LacI family DNA-binding transcriptional regulator [Victivallales bacterium]
MTKRKPTLKDIAEKAGVSLTAASMYLNGKAKKYKLADATCERIEKVIRKYNFIPNCHARAIASKRTMLLGVQIYENPDVSFWLKIISGIEEIIETEKYHMIFSTSHSSAEKELESVQFMMAKGIDGLIIAPTNKENNNFNYFRKLNKTIPVVTINTKIEGVSAAYNDNYSGGRIASEYLVSQGHRRIAFVGNVNFKRAEAFFDVMRENKMKPGVFPNVSSFLQAIGRFTAVFCFSDYQVLELYNEAASKGIKVPDDISVVGYDNMDFIRLLSPLPGTVDQCKKEVGIAAAEIVMSRLKGKTMIPDSIFKPVLREGESVKNIISIPNSDEKGE